MTVSVGMDQVRHHIEALAVDVLLAWMMKMELLEYVRFVADRERATWGVVDLNGVSVVDDVERNRLVIEFQRRQVRFLGVLDVDGRLFLPDRTRGKRRVEFAPSTRPFRPLVGPLGSFLANVACRRQSDPENPAERQCLAGKSKSHRSPPQAGASRTTAGVAAEAKTAGLVNDRRPAVAKRNRGSADKRRGEGTAAIDMEEKRK